MATFGLIIGNRSFFPDHVVASARRDLVATLAGWGHASVVLSEADTKGGGVETISDARKCAELFKVAPTLDGILVCMPNFGDELSIAEAIRRSGRAVPVLIQAVPDDPDRLDLANRRDSFCGKISLCNNLRQLGIPFTLTSKHVSRLDSASFRDDVARFAAVCRIVSGLRTARIGAIGARPDAFHTVRYSEKLLQKAGIDVAVVDLSMILHEARAWKDEAAIRAKIAEFEAYGTVEPGVPVESVEKLARLTLALEAFVEENGCTASAIQCWDSVQKDYGVATCLPMSLMGMKGKPSACEMDVMGALSMRVLLDASGVPPMLQDWNNNYADEPDKCINIHCSNYPACQFETKPDIGYLDILSTTLGRSACFGACKGRVKAGPMTYLRVSTDDAAGRIRCYVGEGDFTDDPLDTFGGVSVCRVPDLEGLLRYLCAEGFEHHVAITQGHVADAIEEALRTYMGWEVHRHGK